VVRSLFEKSTDHQSEIDDHISCTRFIGMQLRDDYRSRQSVLYAKLHPTVAAPEEMERTFSSSQEQRRMLMLSILKKRLFSAHSMRTCPRELAHLILGGQAHEGLTTASPHFDIYVVEEEESSNWQETSTGTFPGLARSDIATAPARRQRCFAPVRTSRSPAPVELERPGGRKLALRKEKKSGVETARGHSLLVPLRQNSFMQHTSTSKRHLGLLVAFNKEQLSRRGVAPG